MFMKNMIIKKQIQKFSWTNVIGYIFHVFYVEPKKWCNRAFKITRSDYKKLGFFSILKPWQMSNNFNLIIVVSSFYACSHNTFSTNWNTQYLGEKRTSQFVLGTDIYDGFMRILVTLEFRQNKKYEVLYPVS